MTSKFDIPEPMRDFADKSVEHARKAFEDYLTSAHKAVDSLETSAQDAQANVREFGEKAIAMAEENMAASFDFASRMVNAKTVEEMLKVQSDFVERQMATISEHSKTLAGLTGKKPGGSGSDAP